MFRNLKNEDVEIASYPVAIVLVTATGNSFIKRRYALAEAKQTYVDLKEESKEKVFAFAENFAWKLTRNDGPEIHFEFLLSIPDYLRNATFLREKKWKLVNRLLFHGYVYLTRNETARL